MKQASLLVILRSTCFRSVSTSCIQLSRTATPSPPANFTTYLAQFGRRGYASKKTLERKAQKQKTGTSSPSTPQQQRRQQQQQQQQQQQRIEPASKSAPTHKASKIPAAGSPAATPQAYVPPATAYYYTLASRSTPTTLFIAPASRALPVTATAVSIFCGAYGIYHLYVNFVLPQPDGLWWGIPYAFGGVSLLMLVLGGWVSGTARRHIGRIDAIPVSLLNQSSSSPSAAGATSNSGRELVLRLQRRRLIPGLKPKTLDVDAQSCSLASRLASAQLAVLPPEEDGNDPSIPRDTGVFAGISGRVGRAIGSFGRIMTRDGLVPFDVRVNDRKRRRFKLDVAEGSWIGEGGLERLVRVRN